MAAERNGCSSRSPTHGAPWRPGSTLAIARGATTAILDEIESSLWTAPLALGRALIALDLARVVARPRPVDDVHGGAKFVLAATATSDLGTRFGKVRFTRPVGHRVGWRRATCDRPFDRALGLGSGFSLATVVSVTRLCAQLAFASARTTFAHVCEWSPSQRTTLRMVDAVGAEARPFLDAAPPPADDGEILVIQVDGGGRRTSISRSRNGGARAGVHANGHGARRGTSARTPRSRSSG